MGAHDKEGVHLKVDAVLQPYESPHDKRAVRVLIQGRPVGHLSRQDAPKYRRRLQSQGVANAAASCGAMIVGGFQLADGSRASYGVRLDIKSFD